MNQRDRMKFLVGILILSLTACSEPTIISNWQNSDISIDGNVNDWAGNLNYFDDEKAAIGVSNDNDYIYFCLTTSDNDNIMKILRTGFTVWLDPQSSDGKTIGIKYPIKSKINDVGDRRNQQLGKEKNNGDNLTKKIDQFNSDQNEILIVNEDKFPLNALPVANNDGLEVNINYAMHQFVYELKVPLANNNLSNVYTDVLPNEIVRVGFESGEVDKQEGSTGDGNMRNNGNENMQMGGRGGRGGGGRGGGGRGGNMGNMKNLMAPSEFWVEVKLSTEP